MVCQSRLEDVGRVLKEILIGAGGETNPWVMRALKRGFQPAGQRHGEEPLIFSRFHLIPRAEGEERECRSTGG